MTSIYAPFSTPDLPSVALARAMGWFPSPSRYVASITPEGGPRNATCARMTSIYAPFAKALRAHATFPPPSSSREQQEAWSKGYRDGQSGVKHSPYESGSDLDSWYNTGYEDGGNDSPTEPEWDQRLNSEET